MSKRKNPIPLTPRVHRQTERREILTKTAQDICFYLDARAFSDRIIALEDIVGECYDKLREKDEEIEREWKAIRA